ncbi:MAG: hypothetical protein AAF360_10630 [Pseudomonadota bacterium]
MTIGFGGRFNGVAYGALLLVLSGCATAELAPGEKDRVVRLVNQSCVIVTTVDSVESDRRRITADSVRIQVKEPLGGGWTRYAVATGGFAGSFFIHDQSEAMYCGEASWPGVERANARL